MKLHWFVAGLALLCMPLASAAGASVLVFGDSLSAGYGVPPGKGWVDLLEERMKAMDGDSVVINASVTGETTQGGVTRIGDALRRHRPSVVVLELGGNDALRGLPLDRTRDNLERMIRDARAAGATVLLLGLRIPPNYGPAYTEQFRALYDELRQSMKVPWVPLFLDGVDLDPELMQEDGIHPTAEAQLRLLDNVWPALEPLLRDGAGRGAS